MKKEVILALRTSHAALTEIPAQILHITERKYNWFIFNLRKLSYSGYVRDCENIIQGKALPSVNSLMNVKTTTYNLLENFNIYL